MTGIITNNLGRSSGLIKTATAADDSITLAKMASGTDGNIISYDASGNPVAIATGSDGQILTSTGAGSPPAFEAAPGGGKILQVVSTSITAASDNTGTVHTAAFADMLEVITATITPSATSSKILCLYTIGLGHEAGLTVHIGTGTTEFGQGDSASNRSLGIWSGHDGQTFIIRQYSGQILHSPSSTSELVYRIKCTINNTISVFFNRSVGDRDNTLGYDGRGRMDFTLMEIGA